MADLHDRAPRCAPMVDVQAPSDAPQAVIAAVTLWRAGEHQEARGILSSLGPRAVEPLFGFYLGLLIEHERVTGVDADLMLREVALDLALRRGGE